MSADQSIDGWLEKLGFGRPEAQALARATLERAGLTRPGKQRISNEKLPRAEALVLGRFFLHCGNPECEAEAQASGRQPLLCEPKSRCGRCGGSDNRKAEVAFLEACRSHAVKRLVVVGGSPAVREELESALGGALGLRAIDGTERRTQDRARSDLEWADLVLIWGGSELHHKVSLLYTQVPPAMRRKVVSVAKRGVAALLAAAVEHLRRP
ncbi:MAG: hypothetical protein HYZ28_27505 [Myxococcales bacterium]|nr:hypothetical protein [Myxococcales bacterium]